MRLAQVTMMIGGMWLSATAFAGPSVPRSLMKQLPADVSSVFDPALSEIQALEEQLADKEAEANMAKSNIRVDRIDSKVADAEIKAEKAQLKAARKAGDKEAKEQAKAAVSASKDNADVADAAVKTAGARAALLKAHVGLIKADIGLKEAKLEFQRAQAVYDYNMEIDTSVYAAAESKAEIKYQEARANVALAEAKLSMRGGDPQNEPGAPEPVLAPAPADTESAPAEGTETVE